MNSIVTQIYQFFNRQVVYHTLIWGFILVVLMAFQWSGEDFWFTLIDSLIIIGFYITIVYTNLYYLIPKYLIQNKFLIYSILLLMVCFILTAIREVVQFFYYEFTNHKEAQQVLISNINFQFLSAFLVVGTSTIFKIVSDWVKHTRERQELQTRTMQSELRFLKSQVNPHFLFNTLNNLYALTLKKDDRAPEIVIKLSEMMRYMLYECNEKRVPLQKEVNYIKNYLELEKLRHGKKVDIHFEVNGRVTDQQIAPLMFIPFLENSFKHGLNNQIEKGFINIVMNVDEQQVHFFIENSKADRIPTPTHRRSGGIGLVNVKRRLNLLYPEDYELEIEDSPKTYAVNLFIDL